MSENERNTLAVDWPPTGPERADAEIAELRRDLVDALATILEQNRRLAVLEHRVSLLESAEATL